MNPTLLSNTARFVLLLALQGFMLRYWTAGWSGQYYFQVLLYPLFIALLPSNTPRPLQLLLAFALGIGVDIFYESPGVHASATVFTAFVRPFIFNRLEPFEGYKVDFIPLPRHLGLPWFARYITFLFAVHLFFYFSVEAFTFFYIATILLKTALSLVASTALAIMVVQIFNPRV